MMAMLQKQTKAPSPMSFLAPAKLPGSENKLAWGGELQEFVALQRNPLEAQPPLVQAKLKIGRPDDEYEQEADRVADQVMSMPEPRVQRACQKCQDEEGVQTARLAAQITPLAQRQAASEEDGVEAVQTKAADGGTVQPQAAKPEEEEPLQAQFLSDQSEVESQIEASKRGGEFLPESARTFVESRFSRDFSGVRLHFDAQSNQTANALNAQAFTVGRDIIFGTGHYAPDTAQGRHLLVHELTHVVQQGGEQLPRKWTRARQVTTTSGKPSGQAIGNQAVQRFLIAAGTGNAKRLQRLTAEEKALDLQSPTYAGNARLQKAYDNSPTISIGESDTDAVKLVQQGLIDDGFDMPISTRKTGGPDGIFGQETHQTVYQFQTKYSLDRDGVVGRQTMGKLDELAGGRTMPKKEPDIEATDEAMGEHVVETMDLMNDPVSKSPTSGVWYDFNYRHRHEIDPANYPMEESQYKRGYADPNYFDLLDNKWDWRLKPGKSASEGIKAWIKGLTIAECNSALVAIEIDTLRAAVGDEKFDKNFGSPTVLVPAQRRLRIKQGTEETPVEGFMTQTEASAAGNIGTFGNRPANKGEWYYFYNHPKYLLKHPGGAWQGENAVFMGTNDRGDQLWSGLGASNVTETGMLDEMVKAYNAERDIDDEEELKNRRDNNGGVLPSKYVLQSDGGTEFEDSLGTGPAARQKILDAPAYTIDNEERKGGFRPESGRKLDATKVQEMRNE